MHRYYRSFIDDEEEFKCKRISTPSKRGNGGGRGTPRCETPKASDHPGCPASYAPGARTTAPRGATPLSTPGACTPTTGYPHPDHRVPAPPPRRHPRCPALNPGCPVFYCPTTPGARSLPWVPGPLRECLRALCVLDPCTPLLPQFRL